MKVRILRRQKIEGEVGTICEVSPGRAAFLLQYGAAEPVKEAREQAEAPAKKPEPKKTTAKKK
ncbi:MAG: hypothetical protein UHU21_02725 [Lachnospiraceae bacterium]|jgi:ribosomal protein L9|nr:hypothetical protein [Lachnospiraceae bacterium]